jgi:hypothetical protein
MYCPECGNDAGGAKFCPECGANLAGVKSALSGEATGKTTGQRASKGTAPAAGAAPAKEPSGRLSPAVIWGGFGALAVVVIVVVIMVSGGFGGSSGGGGATQTSAAAVQPVAADTSGTFSQLVARANGLYDQGDTQFKSQHFEQGSAYFTAAAKVYAAAWKQQATDPGVGTDYAVALFYSGDIPGATRQVDAVLKANPGFQKGWLNKGIFLSHEARLADQNGDKKQAAKLYTGAKAALTRAVAIDPQSAAGKQADASLQQLPK